MGTVALVAAAVATVIGLEACGRVIAPPPPAGNPDVSEVGRVAGDPRVIAPRAARRLSELGFTTRRFGTDSLWGWRAPERIAARLRYATGSGDSARVLIELWGPCPDDRRGCLRPEAFAILAGIRAEDAPPQ